MRKTLILTFLLLMSFTLAIGQNAPKEGQKASKAMKMIDHKDLSEADKVVMKEKMGQTRSHKNITYKRVRTDSKAVILDESFEIWPPTDWGFFELGDAAGWQQGSSAYSGDASLWHTDDNVATACQDWAMTPALTIDNADYLLMFWEYLTYDGSYYDQHKVSVFDGPDPSTATELGVLYDAAGTGTWTQQILPLAAYNGQTIYIGFYYQGDYADEWAIDNVEVGYQEPYQFVVTAPTGQYVDAGASYDYTVTIENTGGNADDFTPAIVGDGTWTYELFEADGATPLTGAITIASGATVDYIIRATVPAGANYSDTDIENFTVTSAETGKASEGFSITTTALTVLTLDYYADFNGSLMGWQSESIQGGKDFVWTDDTGNYGAFANTVFASTTASNGFAIFDNLDGAGLGPNPAEAALVSPEFDLTGETYISMSFEHMARQLGSGYGVAYPDLKLLVEASTDDFATDIQEVWSYQFPADAHLEISGTPVVNLSALAGESSVKFRLRYLGGGGYWWLIDDINIFAVPANDITVDNVVFSNELNSVGDDVVLTANITNVGGATQTDVAVTFNVDGNDITQTVATIDPAQTVEVTATWAGATAGRHLVTVTVPTDGDDSNNEATTEGVVATADQLAEGFEGTWTPTLWEAETNWQEWTETWTPQWEGAKSAACGNAAGFTDAKLITPLLEIGASEELNFYATVGNGIDGTPTTIQVMYSADKVDWTAIGSLIELTGNMTFYTIDLSSITGDYYLAFNATGAASGAAWSTWAIVDHIVGPIIKPLVPEAVTLTAPADAAVDVVETPELTWTPANTGGLPAGFEIYVDENEDPTTLIETAVGTPHTLTTPLAYNTTYYWKVVATNDVGDAPASEVWSFTTREDPVLYPDFVEDFSGADFPPANWSEFKGILADPVETTGTTSAWSKDGFANIGTEGAAGINNYGTTRNEWFVTAPIDLGDGSVGYQLSFNVALTDYANNAPAETNGSDDKFAVVISLDNGETWTSANTLALWDNAGTGDYVYNDIPMNGQQVLIDLTAYTGLVKIGFYAESTVFNADNDLFIDNVAVGVHNALTLVTSPVGAGTLSGAGQYIESTPVNISATANAGFIFDNWTDGSGNILVDGADVPYGVNFEYIMPAEDATLTANFVEVFAVDFSVVDEGAATLAGVTIEYTGEVDGSVVTDGGGLASVELPAGAYTGTASKIGYTAEEITFTVVDAALVVPVITLTEAPPTFDYTADWTEGADYGANVKNFARTETFEFTNIGTGDLIVEEADFTISGTDAALFSLTTTTYTITTGATGTVDVEFLPTVVGDYTATLFYKEGAAEEVSVALSGSAYDAHMAPFAEDFETGTFDNWFVVNGEETNQWHVGTADGDTDNLSAIVSNDGGVTNEYDNGATSVSHFYMDFEVPAGTDLGDVILSFDYKGQGESTFDYLRVLSVTPDVMPVAGTNSATGQLTQVNLQNDWTNVNIEIPVDQFATTRRIVFTWRNDGSLGDQPALAIDNIKLVESVEVLSVVAIDPIDVGYGTAVEDALPTEVEVELDGEYFGETNVMVPVTWDAGTPAYDELILGTYAFVGTLNPTGGIFNTGAHEANVDVTVSKKELTVTAENKTKVYGDDDPELTAIYAGFIAGEDESVLGGLLEIDRWGGESVGTYTITVSGLTSDTYTITYVDGVLDITERDLTIIADSRSKREGDELIFDGTEFTISELTPLVVGDEVTSATITSDGAASGAVLADYDILISDAQGAGVENYNITYVNGTLTVTDKIILEISDLVAESKVYDATTDAVIADYGTIAPIETGDDVTLVTDNAVATFGTANVGTGKTVTVTGLELAGVDAVKYQLTTAAITATANITHAPFTVTADDAAKVYGEIDPVLTATYAGFVADEDDTVLEGDLVVEREVGEDAGTYAINVSGISSANYSVTFVQGAFTIDQTALSIIAVDNGKVYGDVDPDLTVNYDGFVAGDDETVLEGAISVEREVGEDAGTYVITASGVTSTNYAIEFVDGVFTIDPADLTITADDKSKVYGEADPDFTVVYDGFITGEDEADLAGTLSIDREAGEDVGSYVITPSGLTSDNYAIEYATASLEISAKDLSIAGTFTVENKEFDGTVTATIVDNNLTLVGMVTGDDVELANVVAEFASADEGADITVSLVSANLSGADNGNYTLTLDGAPTTTADILPATVYYEVLFSVGDGEGTIVASVDGTDIASGDMIEEGTIVSFTATPADGYEITAWVLNGNVVPDLVSADVEYADLDMDLDLSVEFSLVLYNVTFNVEDENGNLLEGATVSFDGTDYTTDADGQVIVSDLANGTYPVIVTKDGYSEYTEPVVVNGADEVVNVTLNGMESLLTDVKVYPNPFTDVITISDVTNIDRVVISSITGQTVLEVALNGQQTINTSELADGVYLVRFVNINGAQAVL
jgi:hypothetical protein